MITDPGVVAGAAVTSAALAVAAIASLSMARAGMVTRLFPPALAWCVGITCLFLASDEALQLHERLGRWLNSRHGVESGPLNHVDDAFILAYIGVAAVLGLLALPTLIHHLRVLAAMVGIGCIFVCAAALDAFGNPGTWTDVLEEILEASGAIALAFVFVREAKRRSPA